MDEEHAEDPEKRQRQHIPYGQSPDPEQREEESQQQGSRSQIASEQHQQCDYGDHTGERQNDLLEGSRFQRPRPAGDKVGTKQHQHHFGKFRGLDPERSETDPTVCPVHRPSHHSDGQQQQDHKQDQQQQAVIGKETVSEQHTQPSGRKSENSPDRLFEKQRDSGSACRSGKQDRQSEKEQQKCYTEQ